MSMSTGSSIWYEVGLFAVSASVLTIVLRRMRRKKLVHHMNPEVQGMKRLRTHTVLGAFESEIEARNNVMQAEASPFVESIGGVWGFKLFSSVNDALEAVHQRAGEIQVDPIMVPGHWQLQGFGDHPIYTNFKYIIPVDPPNVPENNPTGYYEQEFLVSETWKNRRIIITFGGVDSAFYVWINRKFVGFSKDSRLPTDFDITDVVKIGDNVNTIQVVVPRFNDGSYLEDQDMWNLSGIFRDVHITSFPKPVHIQDFNYAFHIDNVLNNFDIVVEIKLFWDVYKLRQLFQDHEAANPHLLSASCPYSHSLETDWVVRSDLYEEGVLVSSSLHDSGKIMNFDFIFDSPSSKPVTSATTYAPRPVGPGFQRSYTSWRDRSRSDKKLDNLPPDFTTLQHRLNVVSPQLWSSERPYVYTLVVSLYNSRDNTLVQAESCRLGFRSVEIFDGFLRVNQRPIMIRGVNYHEHDPVQGHTLGLQLLEADIKLMKRHNFNAIRTSHYPQTPIFYELCTLYGLYVVDEANIETHGMKPYVGRLADSWQWEKAFMRRLLRMVWRDQNHTSIIAWSLGNESGYGRVHDKMATWLRKYDRNRVVMYEPATYGPRDAKAKSGWFSIFSTDPPKLVATDVLCPMYARASDCVVIANRDPDMPVILCEYAHMMGNSGGNLDIYWKWFNNFSRLQGGFIWDWCDQGISTNDSFGNPMWGYGGDFGESYHDGTFCLNGLCWPDRGLGSALSEARSALMTMKRASVISQLGNIDDVRNRTLEMCAIDGEAEPLDLNSRLEVLKFAEAEVEMSVRRKLNGLQSLVTCPSTGRRVLPSEVTGTDFHDFVNNSFLRGAKARLQSTNASVRNSLNLSDPGVGLKKTISIALHDVIVKPQLLEAKQCMKVFECEVTGLHPTVWQNDANVFDNGHVQAKDVRFKYQPGHVEWNNRPIQDDDDLYNLKLTVHFSILNRMNHIKELEHYLVFDAVLLCDGIVVDRKPLLQRNSYGQSNMRHMFDPNDGMAGLEESEMLSNFVVPLHNWALGYEASCGVLPLHRSCGAFLPRGDENSSHDPKQNAVWTCYGYSWPSDAMLSASAFDHIQWPVSHSYMGTRESSAPRTRVNSQGESDYTPSASMMSAWPGVDISYCASSKHGRMARSLWTDITPATKWTVAVISRLANDEPWARAGYPMGFTQSMLSSQLIHSLLPSKPGKDASVAQDEKLDSVPTLQRLHSRCNSVESSFNTMSSADSMQNYDSFYDVSVHWKSKSPINGVVIPENCDILLRAESRNPHPEDEKEYPRSIEICIDSSNGLIKSICHNRSEQLLLSQDELESAGDNPLPFRLQLHRAPTDNDRGGYLSGWEAAGMDRAMVMVPNQSYVSPKDRQERSAFSSEHVVIHRESSSPRGSDKRKTSFTEIEPRAYYPPAFQDGSDECPLEGAVELPLLSVLHVKLNNSSKSGSNGALPGLVGSMSMASIPNSDSSPAITTINGAGKASGERREAYGVTCKWRTRPVSYNKSRVAILKLLNGFAQDSMKQVMVVEVESNASEAYLHQLAGVFRFGRESLRPLTEKTHSITGARYLACRVRIWKPVLYMVCTTPKAEEMSVGPFGGLTYDEDVDINQDSSDINRPDIYVDWEATYSLSNKGELLIRVSADCTALPSVIPRVGIGMALRQTNAVRNVTWRGLGPHENYPDRTAAAVSAVHEAPADSLHVPYIRPSENGSRGGVYWVQFNDGYWTQKRMGDDVDTQQPTFRTAIPKLWESIDEEGSVDETSQLPKGCSMTVRCSKLFNFSVQEFTPEALSATTHCSSLHRRALVCKPNSGQVFSKSDSQEGSKEVVKGMFLNIDPYLMGVGGDDSWSACVHEGYLLPPAVYNFKVSLTFHNPEDR